MPKAEVHLHLDGSLRIATAIEIARTRGIDAPADWFGMSEALVPNIRYRAYRKKDGSERYLPMF